MSRFRVQLQRASTPNIFSLLTVRHSYAHSLLPCTFLWGTLLCPLEPNWAFWKDNFLERPLCGVAICSSQVLRCVHISTTFVNLKGGRHCNLKWGLPWTCLDFVCNGNGQQARRTNMFSLRTARFFLTPWCGVARCNMLKPSFRLCAYSNHLCHFERRTSVKGFGFCMHWQAASKKDYVQPSDSPTHLCTLASSWHLCVETFVWSCPLQYSQAVSNQHSDALVQTFSW